jgi:hypothetical protein
MSRPAASYATSRNVSAAAGAAAEALQMTQALSAAAARQSSASAVAAAGGAAAAVGLIAIAAALSAGPAAGALRSARSKSEPAAHDLLLPRIGADLLQSAVHSDFYVKLTGHCHWHVQAT